MLRRVFYSVIFFMLLCSATVKGQCPVNIGFDLGDFTNWEGYTGSILADGTIDLPNSGFVIGQHTIISRAAKMKDPYGNFNVASPNGSQYVVQLGNSGTGRGAERLTYTMTVPQNNTDFSLIYYYAVVFQNPNHLVQEQPKFTANVFDVTNNKYANCGTFEFVASGNLPGFKNATNGVVYKDWSPVTINLAGYAGKTIRLEFTTNDCSKGGHFGYAYLDLNQNCRSPVTGNVQCPGSTSMVLSAPSGFAAYHWYKGNDYSNEIGSQSTLPLSPMPNVGDKYSVRIVPYPGIGCEDTITTTIQSPESLVLKVKSDVKVCRGLSIDITKSDITAGSDPSFTYTYYTDAAATQYISDPTAIVDSGTYYIKATSPGGCEYLSPIKLSFLATPTLSLHNPAAICAPGTVDITTPAVRAGSKDLGPLSYWIDAKATTPLDHPDKVSKSGTYYIRSVNSIGCYDIQPVTVLINYLPELHTADIAGCEKADITVPAATIYHDSNLKYSYWKDAAATDTLSTPNAITQSGTYYIKVTTAAGCNVTAAIQVNVYPYPYSVVTDPPSVIFPETMDITQSFTRQNGTAYYFYQDSLATRLIPDPTKISLRGTYYIKAVNGNDCSIILPVHANIDPPKVVDYGFNTFSPNGDGKNDTFRLKLTKAVQMNHFRIYNAWGALLFETTDYLQAWDGTYNGKKMPVGTYYWIMEGYDNYGHKPLKKTGSVTIVL